MGPIHVLSAFVPPMIAARRGGNVAACLLKGVRRDKHMVCIAAGAFFQRVFPWPYERAMKRLNDYLASVAAASE